MLRFNLLRSILSLIWLSSKDLFTEHLIVLMRNSVVRLKYLPPKGGLDKVFSAPIQQNADSNAFDAIRKISVA